jgi:metal-responsive CopG/Arc/MetJ family transcriptional regulator
MKTSERSPDRTLTLSFRLPERLIKRVDLQAEKETRNRVNMIQVLLQEALDRRKGKSDEYKS